jgi:2,3-diketo-5-methylthio-1-phosphopentane phosphatase
VRFDLREHDIGAVVLDIEGTTTPVSFVYDVLFPYARRELRSYLQENVDAAHLREALQLLHRDWHEDEARRAAPPPWQDEDRDRRIASIAAYAEWLMDRDRKAAGLKALQGHIWARGYDSGVLRGDVFPDVPAALARWHAAGRTVAIFSSGSVLAQQMLFRTSTSGDLTRYIDAFFDTAVGPKMSMDSYRRIADRLHRGAGRLLFISDTVQELEAARAAGWEVLICVRPGHQPPAPGAELVKIADFGEVLCG